jgi:hypothetical protein
MTRIAQTIIAASALAWTLGVAAQTPQPQPPVQPAPPPQPSQPAPSAQPSTAEMTAMFKKADVNGDGKLTRDEADKVKGLPERFDAMDKNKDGMLDFVEFMGPRG